MAIWQQWLLAARPKTLTAAIVPILSASALAYAHQGMVSWFLIASALLSAILIQIGTNLVNDAVDFKNGADTDQRLGPTRVTQAGIFSIRQVLLMATLVFSLAILAGIPLVQMGGWPIVLIGLVSVMMGYAYTAGPIPLAYWGLGDLFVVLFFGLIAVGGVFYLQTGDWNWSCSVLGLQIGLLSTVLIAINNLRDHQGDRLVGKKTWAVRFGPRFVRYEIAVLLAAPYLMSFYWLLLNKVWAVVLPLLTLPLAVWLVKMIFVTEPSPVYNKFLGKAALLHMAFGLLTAVGFLL